MRTLLAAGAVTFFLTGAALAQMCGAPQQTATTAQAGGMQGCMGMMRQTQADDPMADKQPNQPQMGGMMCPCCKNMAMMGGTKQGGTEQKHDMTPKQ
jgi:hypothetical protein